MAVSGVAERVLAGLRPGRRANLPTLRRKLGLDAAELEAAVAELVAAGLVARDGRRVSRTSTWAGELSCDARELLEALPKDGSRLSNLTLRSKLNLDDDAYARARLELVDQGLVERGPGRGGTLARSQEVEMRPSSRGRRAVTREEELYRPFADWVGRSLEGVFTHVAVTGARRRARKAGRKWAQPDVTAVTVTNYQFLPGAAVEVSTYEIKRAADADNVRAVYEAAAHGRWAHRASLVVEGFRDEELVSSSVQAEVERFDLGLYVVYHQDDGAGFDPHELRQPGVRGPEPENLNELLSDFFREERDLRERYRAAIGG